MSDVIKTCSCGRSYDVEQWYALPGVGRMGDGERAIDLRTCPCLSTIAVLVSDLEEEARLCFEVRRVDSIERYYDYAKRALRLVRLYADEDRARGCAPCDDTRVVSALRQVAQYRSAIRRVRRRVFTNDAVLLATMDTGSTLTDSQHEKNEGSGLFRALCCDGFPASGPHGAAGVGGSTYPGDVR